MKQTQAIQWAIEQAEILRGALIGNPDTSALEAHDAQIALAKKQLSSIKAYVRELLVQIESQ